MSAVWDSEHIKRFSQSYRNHKHINLPMWISKYLETPRWVLECSHQSSNKRLASSTVTPRPEGRTDAEQQPAGTLSPVRINTLCHMRQLCDKCGVKYNHRALTVYNSCQGTPWLRRDKVVSTVLSWAGEQLQCQWLGMYCPRRGGKNTHNTVTVNRCACPLHVNTHRPAG